MTEDGDTALTAAIDDNVEIRNSDVRLCLINQFLAQYTSDENKL